MVTSKLPKTVANMSRAAKTQNVTIVVVDLCQVQFCINPITLHIYLAPS